MNARTVSVRLADEEIKKYKQKFNVDSDSALLREALDKVHKEAGFWVSFFDNCRLRLQISDLNSQLQKSTEHLQKSTDIYRTSTDELARLKVIYGNLQISTEHLQKSTDIYRNNEQVLREALEGSRVVVGIILKEYYEHIIEEHPEIRAELGNFEAFTKEAMKELGIEKYLREISLALNPIASKTQAVK